MTTNLAVKIAKIFLWFTSWLVALWFMAARFMQLTTKGAVFRTVVAKAVGQSSFYGSNGPVIALAILALLYLELEKRFPKERRIRRGKQSWLQKIYKAMWTHPLVVKSPMGTLTFMDILATTVVLGGVSWLVGKYFSNAFREIDETQIPRGLAKWQLQMREASAQLAKVIPFTVALLFLPVTRGSPILRVIDVPFEQAVRYHRWLGHLTMVVVTAHGITFAIFTGSIRKIQLLAEWTSTGISILAGVVAAVAGIIMWITSLPSVRTRRFNLFYYVHHLYLVFFAFYAFHVGWGHIGEVFGPIFLFFIDRFLRLIQSRRCVGASARVLPSGAVEIMIPKQRGFNTSALGFLYINIPRLSPIEWHPFSTTSSPCEKYVTMCVKPLGDWTHKLQTTILAESKQACGVPAGRTGPRFSCPVPLTLRVEGPYGHESNYFLRYDKLILVAGGVGVTPFLAIIRDLLLRYELQQQHLPTSVQLIWCVKRSSELVALQEIYPSELYLSYAFENPTLFTLEIQAYVTRQEAPKVPPAAPLEGDALGVSLHEDVSKGRAEQVLTDGLAVITPIANLWLLATIVFSVVGFFVTVGFFHEYVVVPNDHPNDGKPFPAALETMLFYLSMLVGTVICGGAMILLWMVTTQIVGQFTADRSSSYNNNHSDVQNSKSSDHLSVLEMHEETLLASCVVTKNSRPNFPDVFANAAAKHKVDEIGILVSGPNGLHESVASACRSRNFKGQTQLHFHSLSFDL